MRCRLRSAGANCLALVAVCVAVFPPSPYQPRLLWDHGPHTQPTPDERALRKLLVRYSDGDIADAVAGVLAKAAGWMTAAVDATVRRIDEDIKYHRRPDNRLGAARDERLERYLRADRLNVLLLSAALQLEASRAVNAVDIVGRFVVDSERIIDMLYALRADFQKHGPVPWPVTIDERWETVSNGAGEPPRSADWPLVRPFVRRWYSAAVARLQALVEVRLAPALIAKGLARFPGDADLLLARGSFVETRLALAQLDASLSAMLYSSDTRQRWRNELSDADRDFQQIVQASGANNEAGVRLARVRLFNGHPERARELLDEVLAGDVPVTIRYLALLFRAAAAEHSGATEAAIRDYEAALNAIPGTQTPMLALGRIADERNQPSEARRWVERALGPDTRATDPWRRYIHGQAWQLPDRMSSLRTLEPQ